MRFTEEHQAFRKVVRDVVDREITPYVDDWERAGTFPAHELFPKLGDLGLLGLEYDPLPAVPRRRRLRGGDLDVTLPPRQPPAVRRWRCRRGDAAGAGQAGRLRPVTAVPTDEHALLVDLAAEAADSTLLTP